MNFNFSKFVKRIIPLNKIIKVLILSDLFLVFGWGLIGPILAIFITQQINGADVSTVGIAIGIYWLVKSSLQMPIGNYLDKNHGEKDDYYFLLAGTLLAAVVPLGYIFATLVWHIYFLQAFQAVAMAMAIPPWGGIFIRHIDKGKEALSWGTESAFIGIGAGLSGIIGGMAAKAFGFTPLFVGVSGLTVIAGLLCLLIRKDMLPKVDGEKTFPVSKPEL